MEYKGSSVQQTLKRVSQSVAYGSIFRPSTHKPRNGSATPHRSRSRSCESIIRASCPPDGLVFDPFCGCGTAGEPMSKKRKARNPFDVPSVSPRYKGATPADMVRALTRPKDSAARAVFDKLRAEAVKRGKEAD